MNFTSHNKYLPSCDFPLWLVRLIRNAGRKMNFAKLGCLFLMVPARRKATASSPHPMPVWMMWLASESCASTALCINIRSVKQTWNPPRSIKRCQTWGIETSTATWSLHITTTLSMHLVSGNKIMLVYDIYIRKYTFWQIMPSNLWPSLIRYISLIASLRWSIDQIYVTKVLDASSAPTGLAANKKGGCTISVRKRGGWVDSYQIGQKMAGWI